jgi:hypothetical protein
MEYNFKDDERLQITYFCCDGCLTLDILEVVDSIRKYEVVEVYAKSELIEDIVKKIIQSDEDFTFGAITFASGDADCDYGDIYCLSINDLNEIWIEPAYRYNEKEGEWKTFNSEATLAYVYQEDVEQDLLDMLDKNAVHTLLFGFDEE